MNKHITNAGWYLANKVLEFATYASVLGAASSADNGYSLLNSEGNPYMHAALGALDTPLDLAKDIMLDGGLFGDLAQNLTEIPVSFAREPLATTVSGLAALVIGLTAKQISEHQRLKKKYKQQ